MSDNTLQKFIQRSIFSTEYSNKCLRYLLSFFNRFQMFLFYQKQRKNPLCKDILQHIYSFYGNNKIILPEYGYTNIHNRNLYLNNLYFYDIKLTRKILEKIIFSNQKSILISYAESFRTKTIPLINAILTRIEKGIDIEENKKILELFKKNNIDIPKIYKKLPDMHPIIKDFSMESLTILKKTSFKIKREYIY